MLTKLFNSKLVLLFVSLLLNAACVQTDAPADGSSSQSASAPRSRTKIFTANSKPRFFNLIAKKEVDFKSFINNYPDMDHITISALGGSSRYSRAELEEANYVVSEFLPGPSGTYLLLVEELNGAKVSQFTAEL